MKTTLKISRLTFLLGIAIWGNQTYASQCNASSNPVNINSSCDGLEVSTSKDSISVGPGVSVSNYYSAQPAVNIAQSVKTDSFTNNGALASSNYYLSGMLVNADSYIKSFVNNGGISTSVYVVGPYYYSALELYGKIDTLVNAGTIAATGARNYGILLGGSASIGALTNQTGQSIAGTASGILLGNGAQIGSLTNDGYITATNPINGPVTNDGIISNGLTLFSGAALRSLTNSGSITGSQYGISNQGTISSLQNSGTIISTSDAAGAAINNINGGAISSLTNTGVLSGNGRGVINSGTSTTIGALSNAGSITGNYGIVNQLGKINSIVNTGNINANGTSNSQAIYNIVGTIGSITNSGSIISIGIDSVGLQASYAIFNTGTINTITNTATVGTPTSGIYGASGVDINNTGTIITLNNAQNNLVLQGNLPTNYNIIINSPTSYGGLSYYSLDNPSQTNKTNFGIDANRSIIPTGASSYSSVLYGMNIGNISSTSGTYKSGFVTTNWNLLPVSGTNQWDLNVNSAIVTPVTSSASANTLAGGIGIAYAAATPISNVGPTSSTTSITSTTNPTGTTTTQQVVTSVSTPTSTSQPTVTTTTTTTSTTVNGVTTTTAPVTTTTSAPTTTPAAVATVATTSATTTTEIPTTTALPTTTTTTTSVVTTQAPTGPNPVMSNGLTFTANVNALTPAQAAQVVLQSNAEGYSSNRTIRLEQMNTVSNTVLDRIDSPRGKGTNTANRVQLDDGRYVWGDIGGSHGNVNGYSGLASFGYNLVDVIIGGDLHRDSQKSYGVFGGVGYSDMSNSQTVVQSFNSTSYYLGGYGSYYLPDNLKLSGVGGYVYSSNNSSRSLPTVGGFTGGNGSDSYGSNGIYAAAKVSKDYVINDSFTLVPFAGQSYAQFWTKGVTETGGGDFNVSVASATSYSTISFAGLDLVMPLVKGVNDPLSLVTFYKFGYDWFANSNSAHSVTATYTNMPLAPATYVGANMGPISQQIGLGLQGAISKVISARIGAVASFNTNGQEYGGGAEIRFKF